jgi:ABC transporter, substrate-binding protein, family 1
MRLSGHKKKTLNGSLKRGMRNEGRRYMKNKVLMGMVPLALAAVLTACSGGDAKKSEGTPIRLVNGKIEIDPQLKELAKKYQEETGQEVVIESLGGGADIQSTVKGYYQAGNMPDIVVFGGKGDFKNWKDVAADLSDLEFAKNTDVAFKNEEGKVVGFPYAIEGYGITYNADILKEAGIDPSTLTSYGAYEKAFETLEEKKDELGLDAVISLAAESGQMYWSTGNHIFGYYFSGGIDRNDKKNFDNFMKGEVDEERLKQLGKFFKLMVDHSDKQVLLSGTYDDQVSKWATGKTAFVTQGNWLDASFSQYDIKFNTGIAPLAFTEEEMPGVLADCPSWWFAYKDSENLDGAKKFFDWLASSEVAQKAMVEDMGMVSPFKNVTLQPTTPLAKSLSTYIASGDTYAWDWRDMPDGMAKQYLGQPFEAYAKGEVDLDGFVELMKEQIKAGVAAQ